MAAPSQITHEWEIDGEPFRLAPRELTGKLAHESSPLPFLAQQISSTAEATYTDINREVEIAFAQDNFSGGLATSLKFNLETQKQFRYSKGIDTSYAPIPILPGPKVSLVGAAIADEPELAVQRGNITYLACGTKLYQVATSTSTPTLDSTFAASITALFLWDDYLIVGQGDSQAYCYRTGDTASSPTSGRSAFTDASSNGRYFASTGDLIYKATRPKTLSIADAINGPWADYDVGSAQHDITSLAILEQAVIVNKEDGPYGFDQDFIAVQLIPELGLLSHANNGLASLTFNRDLYLTTRLGLVRIRSSEGLKQVGLDLLADPALPGGISTIDRLTSDGRFLYALVAPGSTQVGMYIWKRDIADTWHNYIYRTDLGEAAQFLHGVSKIGSTAVNAILFAYKSGSNWQVAYGRFPGTLDPTKDTAYQFEDTVVGTLRTLDYTAQYPTVQKYSDRLKSVADGASNVRQSTYSAWLDDETSSRALATFQRSPFEEADLRALPPYHRLALEITVIGETATAHRLKAFHMSSRLLPREVRRHTVQFLAVDQSPLLTGGRQRRDADSLVTRLQTLRNDRKALAIRDENGRRFTAYLEDYTEYNAQERIAQGGPAQRIVAGYFKEVAAL